MGGGRAPTSDNDAILSHFAVIQTSGEECKDHGVPDQPVSVYDGAMVSVERKIFFMGGIELYSTQLRYGKSRRQIGFQI